MTAAETVTRLMAAFALLHFVAWLFWNLLRAMDRKA